MSRPVLIAVTALSLLTAGCEDMSREEAMVVGGIAGASAGYLTAKALDADPDWIVITTLAGAAIGTLVARNRQTDECAYKWRDGRYRIARCR